MDQLPMEGSRMKRNIVRGLHIGTVAGVLPASARAAVEDATSLRHGAWRAYEINIQEHPLAVRYEGDVPMFLSSSCPARYEFKKAHHEKGSVLSAADERRYFLFSPANVGCNIPVGVGIADTCVLSVGTHA